MRAWRETHREQTLAADRTYKESHREQLLAYSVAWARAHPEQVLARSVARRARLKGATGTHTATEWREKLELFAGCCIYCGRDDVPMTRDHKIPLSRGGSNAIENILPACHSCNSRKRAMTADEFLARRAA